jgi:hypothetical protein
MNERYALLNSDWLVQTSWEGSNIFFLQLKENSDFKLRRPESALDLELQTRSVASIPEMPL